MADRSRSAAGVPGKPRSQGQLRTLREMPAHPARAVGGGSRGDRRTWSQPDPDRALGRGGSDPERPSRDHVRASVAGVAGARAARFVPGSRGQNRRLSDADRALPRRNWRHWRRRRAPISIQLMAVRRRSTIVSIGSLPSARQREESYGTADRSYWTSDHRERPASDRQAAEKGAGVGGLPGDPGRPAGQPRAAVRPAVAVSGVGSGAPQPAQLPVGAAQGIGPKRRAIPGCRIRQLPAAGHRYRHRAFRAAVAFKGPG